MNDLTLQRFFEVKTTRLEAEHALALSAAQTALRHAMQAGRLLLEVKNKLPHGEFLPWIEKNLTFSDRTARVYMQVARNDRFLKMQQRDNSTLTIDEAIEIIAEKERPKVVEAPTDRSRSVFDRSQSENYELCQIWPDQLFKYAIMLDVAGYDVPKAASILGLTEESVSLALNPVIPQIAGWDEFGSGAAAMDHWCASMVNDLLAAWRCTALRNALYGASNTEAWASEFIPKFEAMAIAAEAAYEDAHNAELDSFILGSSDYVALSCMASDLARMATGIVPTRALDARTEFDRWKAVEANQVAVAA